MYKIKLQNFRLKAGQIEIIHPLAEFDTEKPLEYDIYAHGIRLGTTTNCVLNFTKLLQNAYNLEKQWRQQVAEARHRGSQVMPEPPQTQSQTILMIANKCPGVDEPLGDAIDDCWNNVTVNRLTDWLAVPHTSGESIKFKENQSIVGEFK
jgi:hypothetical protein